MYMIGAAASPLRCLRRVGGEGEGSVPSPSRKFLLNRRRIVGLSFEKNVLMIVHVSHSED